MLIPYRPFASSEDWLKQRLALLWQTKPAVKLVSVGLFSICLFAVLAVFSSALWSALGEQAATAAEYAATASMNQLIVACFGTASGICITTGLLLYLVQPTHLKLGSSGAELVSKHGPFQYCLKKLAWSAVSSISLSRQIGTRNTNNDQLLFHSGSKLALQLNISAISSLEQRACLKSQLEMQIPNAIHDEAIMQALEAPRQQAYTELWLQALATPSKKMSLEPLAVSTQLKNKKYELICQLASGGQGTVYLAKDSKSGEEIVLKEFVLPVYVDIAVRRQALKAFENEARILQQLSHPGIVDLLDFFAEDQRGYLVLEYIQGKSLKQIIEDSGRLDEKSVVELALQMCEPLIYLHSLTPPIVHRDFTPDNLILTPERKLKLIDFNVAQQSEPGTTGSVVGKHAYLAPEQFRGQACPQSDIYSLGASLFFLITGSTPEPIACSHPKAQAPEISKEFDFIVAKATSVDQSLRYANASELKSALSLLKP